MRLSSLLGHRDGWLREEVGRQERRTTEDSTHTLYTATRRTKPRAWAVGPRVSAQQVTRIETPTLATAGRVRSLRTARYRYSAAGQPPPPMGPCRPSAFATAACRGSQSSAQNSLSVGRSGVAQPGVQCTYPHDAMRTCHTHERMHMLCMHARGAGRACVAHLAAGAARAERPPPLRGGGRVGREAGGLAAVRAARVGPHPLPARLPAWDGRDLGVEPRLDLGRVVPAIKRQSMGHQ